MRFSFIPLLGPVVPKYLCTANTEVKSLGVSGTRFVKMNSNLVLLHLVRMYRASVSPRNLDSAERVEMLITQLNPTAEKVRVRFLKLL